MLTTATRVPHHALLKGRRALLDVGHSHVLRKQIAYDERLIRQRWSAGYRSHTTTTVAHDVARQPGVSSVAASNEPSWKSTARFAGAVVVAATAAAAGAAAVGSLFKADDDRVVSATATQLSSALCLTPVPKGVGCAYRRRIQDMYRLVDNPVGQGAFGVVSAGVHLETGEVVAIKQIPRSMIQPSRLQAEVDLLRMAGQHKNVVNFRDLFSDENEYYIVMEFATGGELFDRLVHKGAYSEHDAASFLREVVDALAYLHANSVVHFDLKPENILLASSDTDSVDVRLVDFGSAFVLGAEGIGETKENSGTVAYSAPEVLRGQPFGTAADMWSLGVVMYILLSGVHPFDLAGNAADDEVRRRVFRGSLSFDSDVWTHISEEAKDLIVKLLDRDPEKRPSANAVLEHPWMKQGTRLSHRPMSGAGKNLRDFHRGRMRLKACLLAVMTGLASSETYEHARSTVGSRKQALRYMDRDNKGYISAEDLNVALQELGEELTDGELLDMIGSSTGNPNLHPGEDDVTGISYHDFLKLVPPLCPSHVFKSSEPIYVGGAMERNFFLVNHGEISLEIEGLLPKQALKSQVRSTPLVNGQVAAAGGWEGNSGGGSSGHETIKIRWQTLGRGESFGEGELLAAAEAEAGAAAAASAATAGGGGSEHRRHPSGMFSGNKELRRNTPGEGPGRGAARGGGVPRATQAICASDVCEVMAVPRHLFANLLDEFPGVRRRLELQAKKRAAAALTHLVQEGLLQDARERRLLPEATLWPQSKTRPSAPSPSLFSPPVRAPTTGRGPGSGALGGGGARRMGEPRRKTGEREAAVVLLVREGSLSVAQGGATRTVGAGEVCVCGVPRRGIPSITSVACSPGSDEATVVEVPLESLRAGKLFTPPALDAFLRVLSVGSAWDVAHEGDEGATGGSVRRESLVVGDSKNPAR